MRLFLGKPLFLKGNSLANIKGANKDTKIYFGRSTTVHNLLFWVHTLCMNYVTNTFLLVISSVRRKQLLCFIHGQGEKSEPKHKTKKSDGFQNHSPLLTVGKHADNSTNVKQLLSNWERRHVTSAEILNRF